DAGCLHAELGAGDAQLAGAAAEIEQTSAGQPEFALDMLDRRLGSQAAERIDARHRIGREELGIIAGIAIEIGLYGERVRHHQLPASAAKDFRWVKWTAGPNRMPPPVQL